MSSKQTCRYILLSSQSTEWTGVIKTLFFLQPARNRGARSRGAAKQESSSGEEEESSEEESEDEDGKKKGVAGLIEVENPNRAKKTHKKVSALDDSPASAKPQLSRREREEILINTKYKIYNISGIVSKSWSTQGKLLTARGCLIKVWCMILHLLASQRNVF